MASQQPPFFRLPRELRDNIYHLAYIIDGRGHITITFRDKMIDDAREALRKANRVSSLDSLDWDFDNYMGPFASKTKRTPPPSLRAFSRPKSPLVAMTVSKQFFEQAAAVYFGNNTVLASEWELEELERRSSWLAKRIVLLDSLKYSSSLPAVRDLAGPHRYHVVR